MTDKEYSQLTKLTQIRTLLLLVRQVVADDEIIMKEDLVEFERKMEDWRGKLEKKIKTR